jgi:hypothetical protein
MRYLLRPLAAVPVVMLGIAAARADSPVGALATNTTSPLPTASCFYVAQWNGTAFSDTRLCSGWATAIGAAATANNLSDLTSASAARTNLGLGTAALASTGVGGAAVPLLNGANTWSGVQTFGNGDLVLSGATSGASTLKAPAAGGGTVTLPPGTDGLAGLAATQTLSNKTINCASNTCTVRLGSDVTGNLAVGNLNSGTGASPSTFWRGDGQWAIPSGNVAGPGSSVSGDIATFNGTGGTSIQDSGIVLSSLAPLASASFTGTPTAPTAPQSTNSTQLATTAFVKLHQIPISVGWIAGQNPNSANIAVINQSMTVQAIVGTLETAVGAAATVTVNVATPGQACAAGTPLHSGSFNANGGSTNQSLSVTVPTLAIGNRICLQATGGANWVSGAGIGSITIFATPS